jgi:hypothetical protein
VKWLVYLIIGTVCLLLLKAGCEKLGERLQAANQKKRKGRRQRQRDNEDGMGLAELVVGSDEGE